MTVDLPSHLTLVQKATLFAAHQHQTQVRSGMGVPYIVRVAQIVGHLTWPDHVMETPKSRRKKAKFEHLEAEVDSILASGKSPDPIDAAWLTIKAADRLSNADDFKAAGDDRYAATYRNLAYPVFWALYRFDLVRPGVMEREVREFVSASPERDEIEQVKRRLFLKG